MILVTSRVTVTIKTRLKVKCESQTGQILHGFANGSPPLHAVLPYVAICHGDWNHKLVTRFGVIRRVMTSLV